VVPPGRAWAPEPVRAVAIDLGQARIGVALCDSGGTVATPYETIERSGDEASDHERLSALASEAGAVVVVVGWPVSLDGTEGPAAVAARAEAGRMAGLVGLPVVMHDERLTTVTAERALRHAGSRRRRRRGVVDQVAAAVLLQSWLDGGGPGRVAAERVAPREATDGAAGR